MQLQGRRSIAGIARALAAALLLLVSCGAAAAELERNGGPYVPTPQIVVDQMLRFANVSADDYVIDLGSGDGVIVLTAAQRLKASGLGVDIDPELVKLANAEAARLGIADRAKFEVMDVFKADLSRATVVTLYLLPGMMANLKAKLYLELKPGTRIVSHDYDFGDWAPDDYIVFDVPEKEKINGVPKATVLLWIVPERIAGRWTLDVQGGPRYDVTWLQSYQSVDGTARIGNSKQPIRVAELRGQQFEFNLAVNGVPRLFTGKATADSMEGTVDLGGKVVPWSAVRVSPARSASASVH